MIPDPLNRQFNNRVSKAEAILRKDERNKLTTQLFPAGKGIFIYMFCQILNEIQWTSKDIFPIL